MRVEIPKVRLAMYGPIYAESRGFWERLTRSNHVEYTPDLRIWTDDQLFAQEWRERIKLKQFDVGVVVYSIVGRLNNLYTFEEITRLMLTKSDSVALLPTRSTIEGAHDLRARKFNVEQQQRVGIFDSDNSRYLNQFDNWVVRGLKR